VLQKAISSLPQENVSVSVYFTCLEGLWDELSILFFFLLLSSFLDTKHFVFSSSTLFHAASSNSQIDNPWIINTRAIDHMISSVSYFTFITVVVSICVKLPYD
jgi:hypothetical protein